VDMIKLLDWKSKVVIIIAIGLFSVVAFNTTYDK